MSKLEQLKSFLNINEATLRKQFIGLEKKFKDEGLDLSQEPYKVTALDLQKKRDAKLEKYMPMLHDFMSKKLYYKLPQSVDFDSLNSEMDIALADELTKYYTTNPERFKKWWKRDSGGKEYRDLNIGPIILKALNFSTGSVTPNPETEGFMARVKGAAYDALRKTDVLSQADRKYVKEIVNFSNKIKDTENREPSIEEIGKFMKWDNEKVKQYLFLASLHDTTFDSSIDMLRGDDYSSKFKVGTGGLNDPENPELLVIKSDMMEKAKTEINKLPDDERNTIELYVYELMSFKEISLLTGKSVDEVIADSKSAVEKITPKLKKLYGSDIVFVLDGDDIED